MAGEVKTHVLVATPHNRLEPECIRSIFTQVYDGAIDHHFTRHNPNPVPGLNILAAYQRLRAIFLAGAYTHLWIVENDVIVPPDALGQLLSVGADMAFGVYCFRRGTPVVNITHTTTTNTMTDKAAYWRESFDAGAVIPCSGLGFGCTLIARRCLERFEMRSEGGGGDADTCLAQDAARAGLVLRAHLGVVCGHKRPDGVVLWPTGSRPFYRRVGVSDPILRTVRAVLGFAVWGEGGGPKVVSRGESAAIDFETAQTLVAAGQAEYVAEGAAHPPERSGAG